MEDKEEKVINDEHINNDYVNAPKRASVKPSFVVGIIFSVLGVAFIIIGIALGLTETAWNVGIIEMTVGVLHF